MISCLTLWSTERKESDGYAEAFFLISLFFHFVDSLLILSIYMMNTFSTNISSVSLVTVGSLCTVQIPEQ